MAVDEEVCQLDVEGQIEVFITIENPTCIGKYHWES